MINAFNTRDTLFVRRAVVMAEILMECQMIESHFFEAVKRCELESFRIIERFVTFYDQHVRKRNAILILYIIIAPMYYIHGGTPPPPPPWLIVMALARCTAAVNRVNLVHVSETAKIFVALLSSPFYPLTSPSLPLPFLNCFQMQARKNI